MNCDGLGCASTAVVQWRRRLTAVELAELVRAEEGRRAEITLLADPQSPPVFGPMPGAGDSTVAVFACADHALDLELAAHIHAAECAAPHPDHMPACDCEPEPHPIPEAPPATVTLPTGWTVPAP